MLRSHAPHDGPRVPLILHWLGRLWCWAYGWEVVGQVTRSRAVLIAHPHTSNWDLPHMIAVAATLGTFCSWLGKESLFKPPFGFMLRWLGGIPVDRSAPRGQVGEAIDRVQSAKRILLVVPPSGTRSRRDGWKSGFYWIAQGAEVPIMCGFLDYGKKRAGIANEVMPSGDVKADMDRIRAFYEGMTGLYPENNTRIYLSAEDTAVAEDEEFSSVVAKPVVEPEPHSSSSPPSGELDPGTFESADAMSSPTQVAAAGPQPAAASRSESSSLDQASDPGDSSGSSTSERKD
ncbi:MAG: glycerol acyltransferase [Deltaproteobacteria bacterium]|nr:MAG: glycerol acyltransferase [Deltaproteobacteria bacterium]